MNRNAGSIAGVLLVLAVLGCGPLGRSSDTTSNASNQAKAEPTPVIKAVDIPSLAGKSVDEVKKALGEPTRVLANSPTWEFPQGDLRLDEDYKKKGKVTGMTFSLKPVVFNGKAAIGVSSYETIADLTGIDLKGKTPTDTPTGDTGSLRFEKVEMNGHVVDEVNFPKVSGIFTRVDVTFDRGY